MNQKDKTEICSFHEWKNVFRSVKIKCIKVERLNPEVIGYRYDYNMESSEISVKQFCGSRKKRKENNLHVSEAHIKTLYQRQLPNTDAKLL